MSTFTELFGAATGGGRLKFLNVTSSMVWTPPAGLIAAGGVIYREIWGGGGGGGGDNRGGGGGGGEMLEGYQTIPDTTPITITIGAGGAAGGAATDGVAGGDTSFGAVVARGGGPGLANGFGGRCFGGGFGAQANVGAWSTSIRGGRGGRGRKGRCHGGPGGLYFGSGTYIGGCGGGGADGPGEAPEASAAGLLVTAPTHSVDPNTGNGGRGRGLVSSVVYEAQPGQSGGVLLVWVERE